MQSSIHPCLWDVVDSADPETTLALVCTYVDDILVTGPSSLVPEVMKSLRSLWKTTEPEYLKFGDEGQLRFMGYEIVRTKNGDLFLHQKRYIDDLLRKFDLEGERGLSTPMYSVLDDKYDNSKIDHSKVDTEGESFKLCQCALGCLIFLSTRTRIDISYAVSRAASHLHRNPDEALEATRRIIRYLGTVSDFGIHMKPFEKMEDLRILNSYSDASFANELGYSHEGIVVMWDGVPVIWRNSRQTLVSLSTAEAELLALSTLLRYTLGFKEILSSINLEILENNLFCDNHAAITSAIEGSSWRSRYYISRAENLRQNVKKGTIKISRIDTSENLADLLTKYLSRVPHNKALELLNFQKVPVVVAKA